MTIWSGFGNSLTNVLSFRLCLVSLLLTVCVAISAGAAVTATPMRPYAGIGVLFFVGLIPAEHEPLLLPLYEEPGLLRVGVLNGATVSGVEWLFGSGEKSAPFIVTARKGGWFRILFDDAGHEGWVKPEEAGQYQAWDLFLKQHPCRLLPGLQPRYYRLLSMPNGDSIGTMQPRQQFRVLKRENDWVMVMVEPSRLGWLRWRDEDGRLLIGFQR